MYVVKAGEKEKGSRNWTGPDQDRKEIENSRFEL